MKVLIVYAHPEPRSLNGALRNFAVDRLQSAGHEVIVSDLYAMGWKAVVDSADFLNHETGQPLKVEAASKRAYEAEAQSADIAAEQRKLFWADVLILQFPMWWFSMPAILKGWVDRVYAYGLAYGVGEHSDRRWGDRYGEGTFKGKRAMLIVTTGGWASHYSERGVNGRMEDLLFPINHGVLYYPGFDVLPPYVLYRTGKYDDARHRQTLAELGERLDTLATTAPIPYRMQNGGDYEIPSMELKEALSAGRQGLDIHLA
ncbi:MAG TPA: NAD(P)H-dependent oxidoreductase [Steroidobacter sp.]|uniref:NAD(P)H-dependent oxidoreductase n=1 Tax=Steroidobacter sp. TaxID=1978227 RepID=UPI002ED8F7FE